jgi:hypothetical protein
MTAIATLDGYESAKLEVDAKAGVVVPVALTLKAVTPSGTATAAPSGTATAPPAARSKVPAYVMGGLGVASLITGGVLLGLAEGSRAQLLADAPRGTDGKLLCWKTAAQGSATQPECDAWRSKTTTTNAEGNAAIGLFVTGGVALAGAAAYWFWAARPQVGTARSLSWTVLPIAGIGSGGAILTGNF